MFWKKSQEGPNISEIFPITLKCNLFSKYICIFSMHSPAHGESRPIKYIVAQAHELRVHFANRKWIEWIKHYEMLNAVRIVRCHCDGITWNTPSEVGRERERRNREKERSSNKNRNAKTWNMELFYHQRKRKLFKVSDCTVACLWNGKKECQK